MKQKMKIFLLLVVLISGTWSGLQAQQAKADARLDTTDILVGDHVDFWLQFQLPENSAYQWPAFQDTLTAGIEILKKGEIDTTKKEFGLLNLEQKLTLTAFDSGYYVIPPIKFRYGPSPGQTDNATETEPYLLNVYTVPVDTTQAIKPIKGPVSVPYSLAELLPWFLLVLLVIALVVLAIYFNKKRRQKKPFVFMKPKPQKPPYEVAIEELEKLKKEKLWQQGHVKNYHSRISEIVRIYIENQIRIRAVELTTWEILEVFRKVDIADSDKKKLEEILSMADLVKFAKARPLPDDHEKSMRFAEDFVKNTKDFGKQETTENQNNEAGAAVAESEPNHTGR